MSSISKELEHAAKEYELVVSPDLKIVSGRLKYGISVDGAVHRDFSMHLLTVREDMAIDPTLEGQARMLAAYSASLDHIGTIQPDVLTPDFLADELVATDISPKSCWQKSVCPFSPCRPLPIRSPKAGELRYLCRRYRQDDSAGA